MGVSFEIDNEVELGFQFDEVGYRPPSKRRLKRERQAYEEAEREDREDEHIV